MIDPHPRHSPANRLAPRSIPGLGLTAAVAFAACSPTTSTAVTPSPSSASSSAPSAVGASPSSDAGGAPRSGQTDTDWGRIWDALPAGFPVYPGATPAEEMETGPVSATFAVRGADPKAIVTWMRTELERATYRTEALNGPLEDGSFVLDSTGTAGCRIEVAAAPLGDLIKLSVRYGAACPNA